MSIKASAIILTARCTSYMLALAYYFLYLVPDSEVRSQCNTGVICIRQFYL